MDHDAIDMAILRADPKELVQVVAELAALLRQNRKFMLRAFALSGTDKAFSYSVLSHDHMLKVMEEAINERIERAKHADR
jgi:hypothetical protein